MNVLIDFHVHAFTDHIAKRAMDQLVQTRPCTPHTDGTSMSAVARLTEWGVDYGVALPIATKPTQHTINDWAASLKGSMLIPFGSAHPLMEDLEQELIRIRDTLGLYGIKIHPDYQKYELDSPEMMELLALCEHLGITVIAHCGIDPISLDKIHAPPKAVRQVADTFPKLTFVAAHMGALLMWDEVEELLVGKNIYFDTAVVVDYMDMAQCERMIKAHGAHRILFASDCPWASAKQTYESIQAMDLTQTQKDMIFYQNAQKLLGDF